MSPARGPFTSALGAALSSLAPHGSFLPVPSVTQRDAWQPLPGEVRSRALARARRAADSLMPELTLSMYLDSLCQGPGAYEEKYFARRAQLSDLCLGELISGEGIYLGDIADRLWALCDEATWTPPMWNPLDDKDGRTASMQLPQLEPGAIDTAALLTLAVTLLPSLNEVSWQLRERIFHMARQRVLGPFRSQNPSWLTPRQPTPFTPWCALGVMLVSLIIEPIAQNRERDLERLFAALDAYLFTQPLDGACREGLGVWNQGPGALLDCALLLRAATGGRVDITSDPQVRALGRYPVMMHLTGRAFASFEQDGLYPPVDAAVVYRYGMATNAPELCVLGERLMALPAPELDELEGSLLRRCYQALYAPGAADIGDYADGLTRRRASFGWLPSVGQLAAHGAGRFHLAVNAGVGGASSLTGAFALLRADTPLIACGIASGDAPLTSVPRVGGLEPLGDTARTSDVSFHEDGSSLTLSMNLADAFPADCEVITWQRTYTLALIGAPPVVHIMDVFDLKAPKDICFQFVCAAAPRLVDGAALLSGVRLAWEGALVSALSSVGGLYLLTLTTLRGVQNGAYSFTITLEEKQ